LQQEALKKMIWDSKRINRKKSQPNDEKDVKENKKYYEPKTNDLLIQGYHNN